VAPVPGGLVAREVGGECRLQLYLHLIYS
jgi:hypothetical protein